jgi:hypothetical protein
MAILKNTTFSGTGNLRLPVGTTVQRPGTPAAGQFRYNTTTNDVEIYTGGVAAWISAANRGTRATGGTVYDTIIEGTTYRVHVFTTTGNSTFTVTRAGTVEYLIVAGGGGGGGHNAGFFEGGGGGAGGLLTGTVSVTPQAYTVTVGDGGAGGIASGSQGQNSSAFGLTAIGGGFGGGGSSFGGAGGSGGGSGWTNTTNRDSGIGGGAGTAGQGNNGGSPGGPFNAGGGGGGAGGVGATGIAGSRGGSGLLTNINGTPVFYAGGGGGGRSNSAIGGFGGGGAGQPSDAAGTGTPGTPNTGGGGGGGWQSSPNAGSAGGSGIVIIRYALQTSPNVTVPGLIDNNLILDLDFSKPAAYAGSGNVVNDSRLSGITGTVNGSLTSFINSRTHRAAFRGNIAAGNDISLTPSCIPAGNELTLVFWNFGKTQQQSSIIAGSNASSQDLNIHLPWVDGNVYWDCGSPFNRISANVSSVYLGWRHWVFTHNANTGIKRIYNNGVEFASGSGQTSSIPVMNSVRIGGYFTGSNYGHDGDIGMCLVYNREISAAEVLSHFNATRWRFGV